MALDDPRSVDFWHREMRELADDMGSTTSDAVRGRQAAFLSGFVSTGARAQGAALAGISIGSVARWTSEDPVFHKAREMAWKTYSDLLIAELTRRAVEGIEVVVRDKHGQVVGKERKYSDHGIMFLLKGLHAEAAWTQRPESGTREGGAWRNDLVKLLADPETRAQLEALSERMGS